MKESATLSKFSLVLLSLLLSLGIVSTGSQPAQAADNPTSSPWPQEVTQVSMYPNLNPVWGTAFDSDISWTFDTRGDMPFTEVEVVDGLAYVGSMMNNIYALDAATGRQVWKFEADNWIMTNPVVADGKLFAGSGNRNFAPYTKPAHGANRGTGSNSLYALNAKTGQMLWRYPIQGEAMPTPLYYQGVVYFITGDRNLYALDANTGSLLYKYYLGSLFSMGSVTRDGDILIFGGGFPFNVYGFNLKTRQLAWTTPMSDVQLGLDDSNAAIANGTFYINGIHYTDVNHPDGSITYINPLHYFYALDTQTGKLRWSFNAGMYALVDDNKSSTPTIVNGVYYGASSNSRQFYALDAATGALKWQYNIGVPVKGGPVVYNNFIIFADAKGNLYALDANTGKLVNKKALGGNVNPQGPTLINGTIYVANQNGRIYAIPAASLVANRLQAPQPAPVQLSPTLRYYKETGQTVGGAFLQYWDTHGGLSQFGYPITGEFQQYHAAEGRTYTVQYFERARLELHDNGQVLLGRLGSEITANNPPNPAAFQAVSAKASDQHYFSATGHAILPDFYNYWQNNGDLARYGYPISDPFVTKGPDGQNITVQYFERDRFELHSTPNGPLILLGLIGRERFNRQ